MANAWLTVDSLPAAWTVRTLRVPDDDAWLAILRGCLYLLTLAENFEQFGTLTPAEMADEWRAIFFQFLEDPPMLIPPGLISPYGGSSAPAGWLPCDGQTASQATYPELFAVLGTTYGPATGGNFTLPNLRSRVPVGKHPVIAEFLTLGQQGGEQTHTLTTAEMPVHTHVQDAHTHVQNAHAHVQLGNQAFLAGTQYGVNNAVGANPLASSTNAATAVNQNATAVNQNAGSGSPHNNLQPYLVLNYIIKT